MTGVRHVSADAWQTTVLVAGGAVIGRWAAGDGFGYVLLATVFGPVAIAVATQRARWPAVRAIWLAVLIAVPFWIDERPAAAGVLTAFVGVWGLCVGGVSDAVGRIASDGVARALVAVGWLAWGVGPLLRADAWGGGLALNPVLMANAVCERAGDWTHQAVAYRWLTTLGQDVAFGWPGSSSVGLMAYAGVAVGLWGIAWVSKRMFHVEHCVETVA